jgi:hypothetical protein
VLPALASADNRIPVDRVLWSIHAEGDLLSTDQDTPTIAVAEHALARWAAVQEAVFESAAARLVGLTVPRRRDWFAAWQQQITLARQQASWAIQQHGLADQLREEFEEGNSALTGIVTQLGLSATGDPGEESLVTNDQPIWLAEAIMAADGQSVYGTHEAAVPALRYHIQRSNHGLIGRMLALTGVTAAVVLLLGAWRPSAAIPYSLLPWSKSLLAVMGIAWWLWLRPSWVGIVLIGLAIVLAVQVPRVLTQPGLFHSFRARRHVSGSPTKRSDG